MSRIPDLKALTNRLVEAKAADDWLQPSFTLPRMPGPAVFDIDKKLGHTQPDDVLMYIRLNTTRWRIDAFEALAWNAVLESDLTSGKLPLLRAGDGAAIGVDTAVAKGTAGHVLWWKGEERHPLPFTTWEAFFEDCVRRLEAGNVAQDPLRIVGNIARVRD